MKGNRYRVSFDVAVDELAGFGVHGHGAGAVDDTVGDDGLGVDAREGLGGFVGEDRGFGGHFEVLRSILGRKRTYCSG